MLIRDTQLASMIRMLMAERDANGFVPCVGMTLIRQAVTILGIKKHNANPEGIRRWEVPVDWPRRLRDAGIDPETLELVDLAKLQRAVRAIEQRRELEQQEMARRGIREGLREATAKYQPPAPPRPSELIRNHVMTGRIVKELRKGHDST